MTDRPIAVAAVVLAAGASQRFGGGRNKLLMPWGERPVLRCVVDALASAGVAEIVVVTGNGREACLAALEGAPVRTVHNEDWASGMGSSIAAGIGALSGGMRGAFVVPGDMPGLSPPVISRLMEAFLAQKGEAIVVPVDAMGEQRNPVLWPRPWFGRLMALTGDKGAKAVLGEPGIKRETIMITDQRVFADIDREEDYLALRGALAP